MDHDHGVWLSSFSQRFSACCLFQPTEPWGWFWPCDFGRAGHSCIDHFHCLQLGTPQEGLGEMAAPWGEMGQSLTWDILGHLKRTKTGRPCLEPLRPRRIQLASRIDPAGAQGLVFGRSTCQVAKHFCKNHGHLRASEGLRVPPSKTPQQIKAYHIHLKHSKTPYHGLSEQLKTHGFPAFFRSDSPPPGLWASQLSATLLRAGRTSQDVAGVQGWNDAFTMLSMEKPSKSSKVVEKMGILHGIRWNMSGIFKNYDFKCNGG